MKPRLVIAIVVTVLLPQAAAADDVLERAKQEMPELWQRQHCVPEATAALPTTAGEQQVLLQQEPKLKPELATPKVTTDTQSLY